jgi:sugar phosphate isomerase/epimerase
LPVGGDTQLKCVGQLKIRALAICDGYADQIMDHDFSVARLAICSWSLQPTDPHDLVRKLKATGVSRVQLALDPLREKPDIWQNVAELLQASGISIISGMFGCVGEDYSTLESIRATGGLAPDATWEQNLENIRATVKLAANLKLKLVTFHAGFLPHDEADSNFSKMIERLTTVAKLFASENISLGLETGQETASALAALLSKLACPNVGVNFDPANMILYDKGDPVTALRVLGPWIRQVHLKDANRTKTLGAWGEEVPVGSGQVDWPRFFATLKELKFAGDFVIEREAGNERVADVCTARDAFLKFNN